MVLVFVYLNCNRQLPGHLQIEDKQVNCAVGFSCEIRPQSFYRRVRELVGDGGNCGKLKTADCG